MKYQTSALLALSSTLLFAAGAAQAGDSAEVVKLTPEQVQWKPNRRVEGLGAAQILGNSKKACV